MAERTTEKALENARQATIAGGEERFLTLAQGDMEGLVRANQALADGASELGRAWLVCWQEQFAEGMELARAVLERQGAFLRSSLERMTTQATRNAELTSGMIDGCFAPLRPGKATERTPKHTA
jgi:hypothetical protein